MSIILCGLPLCGKTTYGKRLAEQLGWTFVDTDHMIEKAYAARFGMKKSCRHIFLEEGETVFRTLEKGQIAALVNVKEHVIATGGGAFCTPENVEMLQSLGCIVYLKMEPEIVWDRMRQKGQPAYLKGKQDFDEMVKVRTPLYEKAAHFITSRSQSGK